ncbi:MAG: metallophosphoesterase [Clostridia bacterium]
MKILAISDLHLSNSTNKPMDIFGGNWENYWQEIKTDWQNKVAEDDVVLIAGDISWAMHLPQVVDDLAQIASLKGKKVIIKGNHDYWWSSYSKVCEILPEGIFALQNNFVRFDNFLICGTRGWTIPTNGSEENDIKIYNRELIRLRLSLDSMQKVRQAEDKVVLMTHFPPFDVKLADSEFTNIIDEFKVDKVVYGHLHGKESRAISVVDKKGIKYYLTSCDMVNNKLTEIF